MLPGTVVMPLKSLIADQLNRASITKGIRDQLMLPTYNGGLTDMFCEGVTSGKYSSLFASSENALGEENSSSSSDYPERASLDFQFHGRETLCFKVQVLSVYMYANVSKDKFGSP